MGEIYALLVLSVGGFSAEPIPFLARLILFLLYWQLLAHAVVVIYTPVI